MPLIIKVTLDMFEFAEVMDYMVNPVNLQAAPGAGLALEFRKRVPDDLFYSKYREACRNKELRMGTIQILEDTNQPWGLINFPTKDFYANPSKEEDIVRGLEALRNTLIQDKYRYCSVGMPMLGCGLGAQDYEVVYPLMIDHLDNLDATVFLSMSPARTELKPRYLTIAGPMDYGITDDQRATIDWSIDKVMEAWGAKLDDYTAIVSGGYPGVDTYVCGEENRKNEHNTFVHRRTGKNPLVIKPNLQRNGVGANLHLGNLLCEIGDDVILFKPKGHNNNRLSAMQVWLQADKEKREREGLFPRRVAIFGDKGLTQTSEDILIPQLDDIPY